MDDKIIQKILSHYESGLSIRKIAITLNVNRNSCSDIIKNSGRVLRNKSQSRRAHKMNENFFSKIDSEEKAYWLGFIAADGCVYKNKLSLNLSAKDTNHLYKFVNCLETTSPVRTVVRDCHREYCVVEICSEKIVNDLKFLEITTNKSLTIEASKNIPKHLIQHYWRGVLDGDGWISPGPRSEGWQVGICGSKSMMSTFSEYANSICGTKSKPSPHGKIFVVHIGGFDMPAKFLHHLYGKASIFLDRKMLLANELINLYNAKIAA